MASGRESWLLDWLGRAIARGGSQVRAQQRIRELRGVFGFNALLGVAVLLPSVLMAWFALATIQSEALLVDAELSRRADAIAAQIASELEGEMEAFEERTLTRLQEGQAPDANLAGLSPHLLLVVRFDEQDRIAAPFTLPDDQTIDTPTFAYDRAYKAGLRIERDGGYMAAARQFAEAASVANEPYLLAQAELARARTLAASGQLTASEAVLDTLFVDFPDVRDRWGFRTADLVALQRAEMAMARDTSEGVAAYRGLVEDLLTSRWMALQPGEPAVARRALARVEPLVDQDWIRRQRTRLTERTQQLYWSEVHFRVLERYEGAPPRPQEGGFVYESDPASGTVWAAVQQNDVRYLFAFDARALLVEPRAAAVRLTERDVDLVAALSGPDAVRATSSLSTRDLAPWMTSTRVVVAPERPELIAERKQERRTVRLIVLALAVGVSVLGLLLSIRLVRAERSTARMKTDFAANVSHELRSPITQIRLKAEALSLGLLYDHEMPKAYSVILGEAERLSRLVDNVLDFAAIEAGAKKYTFRPEDLGNIVHKSVHAAMPQLDAMGMVAEVDVPSDVPVVHVDAEAIGQVLTNLLSNACKYGGQGAWVGVKVEVQRKALVVRVSDRGIGIAPEDVERLFDDFFRSSDPAVRRQKGTGIGLSIVRYIVEAHGGQIRATSQVGHGTTFHFTLPLDRPERPTTGSHLAPTRRKPPTGRPGAPRNS